jgi:hypothetical protein
MKHTDCPDLGSTRDSEIDADAYRCRQGVLAAYDWSVD